MKRYRWSSLVVQSNMPLPELASCDSAAPTLLFERQPDGRPARKMLWVHQEVRSNGARWLSIARNVDGYTLQFPRLADFTISADFRMVRCAAAAGTSPETIRHLFLDHVLPMMESDGPRICLHASAVALGDAAVGFLGRSGKGKSTLAAAFGLRGAQVVSDDSLVLDERENRVVAIPTYPSLRLWPEAMDHLGGRWRDQAPSSQGPAKLCLGRDNAVGVRFRTRPIPLTRLYVLERTHGSVRSRITPLFRRQSFIALAKNRRRLDTFDRQKLEHECAQLAQFVLMVPVARLRIPSDLAALSEVRRAILADIRLNRPES